MSSLLLFRKRPSVLASRNACLLLLENSISGDLASLELAIEGLAKVLDLLTLSPEGINGLSCEIAVVKVAVKGLEALIGLILALLLLYSIQ